MSLSWRECPEVSWCPGPGLEYTVSGRPLVPSYTTHSYRDTVTGTQLQAHEHSHRYTGTNTQAQGQSIRDKVTGTQSQAHSYRNTVTGIQSQGQSHRYTVTLTQYLQSVSYTVKHL